jgi:hypothetical protein
VRGSGNDGGHDQSSDGLADSRPDRREPFRLRLQLETKHMLRRQADGGGGRIHYGLVAVTQS